MSFSVGAGSVFVTGPYTGWNLLAHPSTVLTPEVVGASTTHPIGLLADGNPGKPYRYSADGTDVRIKANLGSAKAFDLLTIHGHNLATSVTFIELWHHTADVFGSATLGAKIVPLYKRASMYIWIPAGVTRQYVWIVFKGNNGSVPIWLGEAALVNSTQIGVAPLHPVRVEHRESHARYSTLAGRRIAYEKTAWATRYVAASFKGSIAQLEQVVDHYRAARGDLHPVLFLPRVPTSLVTGGSGEQLFGEHEKLALFGKLEGDLIEDRSHPAMAAWTIAVQEDPFTEPMA